MDIATWIEILLAAAGVGVAAVAVMVALATIVGWIWFNRLAKKTAAEMARKEMQKFLDESNIRQMLNDAVRKEAHVLYSDMDRSPGHDLGDFVQDRDDKEKND